MKCRPVRTANGTDSPLALRLQLPVGQLRQHRWRGLSTEHCRCGQHNMQTATTLLAPTLRWHRGSCSYHGEGIAAAPLKGRRCWRGLSLWARTLRWHRGSCSYLRYCGSTEIQHRWRGLSRCRSTKMMFYRFGHEMAWTKLIYGNRPARTQCSGYLYVHLGD